TERCDLPVQRGQAAVHFRGACFGLPALIQRRFQVLANTGRARGEEGSGILSDQISQAARQDQEIHPLPNLQPALFFTSGFVGFFFVVSVLLSEAQAGREGQREDQAFHAALRLRIVSAIRSASAELSADSVRLAASTSAAS